MVISNLKLLIKSNIKTFISILLLIMLGVGFYVGMKISVPNIKKIVSDYYEEHNFYDITLSSSIGFTNNEINKLSNIEGVELLIGGYSGDALISNSSDQYVIRIHSISDKMNLLELISGSLPKENEIVIEEKLSKDLKYNIGDTIIINNKNVKNTIYKISGIINSPLYLSNNKGETNLLSGKVNYYGYIGESNFDKENYDSLYIKVKSNSSVDSVVSRIKTDGEKIISDRYYSTILTINDKINTNEAELNEKKLEYTEELRRNQELLDNAELELKSIDQSIPSVEEANRILKNKESELNKLEKKLNDAKKQIDESEAEYNKAKAEYDNEYVELGLAAFNEGINELKREIENTKRKNNELINELKYTTDAARIEEINNQISSNEEELKEMTETLSMANSLLVYYNGEMDYYDKQLKSAKEDLDQAKYEYSIALNEYNKMRNQLNARSAEEIIEAAKIEVEENRKILEEKRKELESKKIELNNKIDSFQNELDDAKDYLKLISTSSWKVEKLEDSKSYSQFLSDIKRIENISNYFPIIFFVVAILVTLTNTTRIIENDREKIGLLKALGYYEKDISNSYYEFAILACLFGSIIGSIIGFLVIPKIFYKIYLIIYKLPKFSYLIDIKFSLIITLLACLIILISVYFSIKNTIKLRPVTLLRPVESKGGKRVILENISVIWNKLNFTSKVTIRNLFKYPKRFLMTIVGISGCIALIVSGFNLRSSISGIIPNQFGNIFDVDIQIFLRDSLTRNEIFDEQKRISSFDEVKATMLTYLKYAYINNTENRVYLVVPEDNNLLTDFVTLKDNKNKYDLEYDSAVISRKIANTMNIKIGDTISVKDSDNNVIEVLIGNITDNYVDNYLYVSKEYYNKLINGKVKYNCLLVRTNDIDYVESDLSQRINYNNSISYLTYTSSAKVVYDSILLSLNYIVYVLVVSALILAFIVLYNLNSLNVFERKREIATLKVLGFTKKETYRYIENEIVILISLGIIFGVIFGYIFSNILINSCELSNLMYDYSIVYINYIYSIAITIIFLIITSLISRRKIDNINMVESLKKNE